MRGDIRLYIGVDPGTEGAMTALGDGIEPKIINFAKLTESEIVEAVRDFGDMCNENWFGSLEAVHSMKGQGVSSTFKFGKAYGFIRGVLISCGVPFEDVTPQTWQKELKCLTKGDKNVSRAKAQQLFPGLKMTNKTCDSVCIAEYTRRLYHLRHGNPA